MPLTFHGAELRLGVVDGLGEGNTGGPGVLGSVAVVTQLALCQIDDPLFAG